MGRYVDLYLLPIPRKHLAYYRRLPPKWGAIMRDHGMLAYREFVASGAPPMKGMLGVDALVKPKKGEVVIFAVAEFKSKAHRDRVNKAAMKDPRMAAMSKIKPVFDMNRMAISEYKTLYEMKPRRR